MHFRSYICVAYTISIYITVNQKTNIKEITLYETVTVISRGQGSISCLSKKN